MKNKNKSKKVQQYVETVQKQQASAGKNKDQVRWINYWVTLQLISCFFYPGPSFTVIFFLYGTHRFQLLGR